MISEDPRMYNLAAYLICVPPFIVWIVTTLRSRFSTENAWFVLAAIAALTLLPISHRQHDAKLLILVVPAGAILFAEGRATGWFALLLNTVAFVLIGDLSAVRIILTRGMLALRTGHLAMLFRIVVGRPVPFVLFVLAIFYLFVYVRRIRVESSQI